MTTLTQKIAELPPNLVREVEDFVDFLIAKYRLVSNIPDKALAEAGMETYLQDLENYETLLAEGKIALFAAHEHTNTSHT